MRRRTKKTKESGGWGEKMGKNGFKKTDLVQKDVVEQLVIKNNC
jgi:hypothetical protein